MVSVYSPAASVLSPKGIHLAAQSPQMPSPALSVSSIVRPQISAFAERSPVIAYRFLAELETASFIGHEAIVKLLLEEGVNVNAQSGFFGNAL